MKQVFVTGAAGYIGSVLCQKLISRGYLVCGIDNLYFNQQPPICFDKSFHDNRAIFFNKDITSKKVIDQIVENFKPDAVIHLAAFVGMSICQKNPEQSIMVNTEATRLLLERIESYTKFIAPNTNSQYGQQKGLCTEESPTNPISLYSVTKCISEALVLNRPNSVSLRLATVYGLSQTRMRNELLVNFMTKELVKGELSIYEPDFMRGAVHINDVSNAFIHAIENDLEGIYNVGDDELNMTKLELANKIANIVGGNVIIGEGEDVDKRDYNVSSAKLYSSGFRIETDFEENIKELAEYYRK
jgi:nucleoside-diphosphate-sugar epimerase